MNDRITQCPRCGKYMSCNISYSYGTAQVGWKCDCGYNTRTDRSGLTYIKVANKYGINTEYKHDRQNERTY